MYVNSLRWPVSDEALEILLNQRDALPINIDRFAAMFDIDGDKPRAIQQTAKSHMFSALRSAQVDPLLWLSLASVVDGFPPGVGDDQGDV